MEDNNYLEIYRLICKQLENSTEAVECGPIVGTCKLGKKSQKLKVSLLDTDRFPSLPAYTVLLTSWDPDKTRSWSAGIVAPGAAEGNAWWRERRDGILVNLEEARQDCIEILQILAFRKVKWGSNFGKKLNNLIDEFGYGAVRHALTMDKILDGRLQE